jgi:hypothetical protein
MAEISIVALIGWDTLSEVVLLACKELIDDAKLGCADLVFKDVCLEILAKARLVLTNEEFEELTSFAAERMKETIAPTSGRRTSIR